jgi:hypothetical protein
VLELTHAFACISLFVQYSCHCSFIAGGDVALVTGNKDLLYYTVDDYQLSQPVIDEMGLDGVTASNK